MARLPAWQDGGEAARSAALAIITGLHWPDRAGGYFSGVEFGPGPGAETTTVRPRAGDGYAAASLDLGLASFVRKEREKHLTFFAYQAKKSSPGIALTLFKIGIPDHDRPNDCVLHFRIGFCNRHPIHVKGDVRDRWTSFFQCDEPSCAARLKFWR